jgi:hypothetical protein
MVILPDGKTFISRVSKRHAFTVVLPDGKPLCLDSLDKVNLQVSL